MGLLSYIRGDRKGKAAHELERKAMQDSFLSEALDGYDDADVQDTDKRCRKECPGALVKGGFLYMVQ